MGAARKAAIVFAVLLSATAAPGGRGQPPKWPTLVSPKSVQTTG